MPEETEIAVPEVDVTEAPEVVTKETVAKPEQTPKQNDADRNWERARAVMEAQKAELDAYRTERIAQQKKAEQDEDDEFAKMPQDELLTLAQAKKLAEKQAKKILKQYSEEFEQRNKQNEQQRLLNESETRMRTKHDDYDYIITNFALPQINNDPALAYQVQMSKDPAAAAYKLGKLSDSYEEQSNQRAVSPKAEKILKNTARPASGNTVSGPLKGQAEEISKMSHQQVWELSQSYAKGHV